MMKIGKVKCVVMLVLFVVGLSHGAITTVSYYDMEGDPGGMVKYGDPTVSGDAAPSGSASTASVAFDGDDYYAIGSNANSATDNFGFEAWVKADSLDGFNFVASNGTNHGGYGLVQVGGKWGILAMGVSGAFEGADVAVGQWQHVAVVWDSGTATLYVDGVASQTGNPVPNPIDSSFTIGANDKVQGGSENSDPFAPVYEGHWKGLIDDVHLFTFEAGQFDAAADLNSVPEPATMLMLGLGGIALIRKRSN